MHTDKKMIAHLNKILGNELIAINQYFLHSRMIKEFGLGKLAGIVYAESIDEMKHADLLIARILFLKGLPNMQDLGKLLIGQTVPEMLACDLKLEHLAIPDLRAAIDYAQSIQDHTTKGLLERILASEEEHIDFLDIQLRLIEQIGEQNYLQSQI